ncbi:hypothetical protein BH24ACT26_BH24ACT26_07990 [soil metagenome]
MATEDLREETRAMDRAAIGLDQLDSAVTSCLLAARDHLDMDIAFVSECIQGRQFYRSVDGDGESFALEIGGGSAVGSLARAGVDWHATVPLQLSDGSAYGTLCCSNRADRRLGLHHVKSLKLLARMIVHQLERQQYESESWRLKIMSTGVQALLAALEARDGYTKSHSEAVVELAAVTAGRLGLCADAVDEVRQVALLHDLGKIALPDPILAKSDGLDEHEWQQVRQHSATGARIVASVDGLAHLAPAIRAGHERWDGCGYPDGLCGEDIPVPSRIVFLCDSYHAMVSDRPYRRAVSHEEAMSEVVSGAGTQFCPATADALSAAT